MLKVAIAGCGLISTMKYIPIFKKLKNRVNLVGLSDINKQALKKVSSKYGISDTFSDFSQMLRRQKPDIVFVCTPPATHTELALEALESGTHLLVEKPMALSSTDCSKMVSVSRKFNKKLGVMHNQIFNPAFGNALNIVSSGKIGEFLGMRMLLITSVHDMTEDKNHWAHKLPGGLTGETGPHAVYLSLAFLRNVQDVHVISRKQIPEYSWSLAEDIRFDIVAENGTSSVTLIYGSNQTAAEIDIICTKGILKVDLQTRILTMHNRLQDNPLISARAICKSVLTNVFQTSSSFISNGFRYVFSRKLDGHYIGVNKFLDFIENDADFPSTGENGKEVEEVMEMIIHKMNSNRISI